MKKLGPLLAKLKLMSATCHGAKSSTMQPMIPRRIPNRIRSSAMMVFMMFIRLCYCQCQVVRSGPPGRMDCDQDAMAVFLAAHAGQGFNELVQSMSGIRSFPSMLFAARIANISIQIWFAFRLVFGSGVTPFGAQPTKAHSPVAVWTTNGNHFRQQERQQEEGQDDDENSRQKTTIKRG